MKKIITLILLFLASTASATVYINDTFDYSDQGAFESSEWEVGTRVELMTSGCRSGKCARTTFQTEGNKMGAYQLKQILPLPAEGYIRFYFKVESSVSKMPKFLKLFGTLNPANPNWYSNFTMGGGSYYTVPPSFTGVSYGGSSLTGDTNCTIVLNNNQILCPDQPQGGPVLEVHNNGERWPIPKERWLKMILHYKLNTNGNADGVWEQWVDGVTVFKVTGVINRNDSNPRSFGKVTLGEYAIDSSIPWYIWWDDVVFATTFAEANNEIGPLLNLISPTTQLAYGTTSATLSMSTTTNSTLRWATTDIAYTAMGNTFAGAGGKTHASTVTVPGTYYVRGSDSTGASPTSVAVSIAVADQPVEPDVCSAANFTLCKTVSACEAVGFYWFRSICNTIPEPADVVGLTDKITGGDLTAPGALTTNWTVYNASGVSFSSNGSGLELVNGGGIAHKTAHMAVGKTYRFMANLIEGGILKEWHYNKADQLFSTPGTVTGILNLDEGGDLKMYISAYSGTVVVNNIMLFELATPDVTPTVGRIMTAPGTGSISTAP